MILNVNSEIQAILVQKEAENYQECHPTDLLSKLKDPRISTVVSIQ